MSIENFAIDLPNTSLAMDTIRMEYDSLGAFRNFTNDVRFSLRIFPSDITLCDLTPFVPAFFPFKENLQRKMQCLPDQHINWKGCRIRMHPEDATGLVRKHLKKKVIFLIRVQ